MALGYPVLCFSIWVTGLGYFEKGRAGLRLAGFGSNGGIGDWLSNLYFTLLSKRFYFTYHIRSYHPGRSVRPYGLLIRLHTGSAVVRTAFLWQLKLPKTYIKSLRRPHPPFPHTVAVENSVFLLKIMPDAGVCSQDPSP
ncbi:hypothetical protein B0I37DRAFT_170170 [Chaetomium sp. MPI-CAGE-AT-0009]|nr:hypothetical protein B0I37DRAFT_170170 [Chaetomium sp. MPI-CAGE-AT-0009]